MTDTLNTVQSDLSPAEITSMATESTAQAAASNLALEIMAAAAAEITPEPAAEVTTEAAEEVEDNTQVTSPAAPEVTVQVNDALIVVESC
jgi:hypothetical protein